MQRIMEESKLYPDSYEVKGAH